MNRKWVGRGLAAAVALGVVTVGGPGAAWADDVPAPVGQMDDGEPLWAEGEQDLAPAPDGEPGVGGLPPIEPGTFHAFSNYCDPGRVYTITNTKNTFDIKYRETDDNSDNSQDDVWEVTVTEAGTTTYGLSVNVEEELSAGIFAKVKASLNGSVSKSMSTTIGTKHTTTVKAHRIVRAEYGIYRENFNFRTYRIYSNCHTGTVKSGSGHAPYTKKWRWIQVK